MTNQPLDDQNQNILFEQYKLFVESAFRTTQRRHSTNIFFLTVNSALFAAFGAVSAAGFEMLKAGWAFFVSACGLTICYYWYRLINSYSGLNKGKFEIIHRIEKELPVQLFADEWTVLGYGKDKQKYHPVTELEKVIPWGFASLYVVLFIWSLLETLFGGSSTPP